MHENRETSDTPEVALHNRPVGEGNSHTTHVHISEESDSGRAPMSHSKLRQDGWKLQIVKRRLSKD